MRRSRRIRGRLPPGRQPPRSGAPAGRAVRPDQSRARPARLGGALAPARPLWRADGGDHAARGRSRTAGAARDEATHLNPDTWVTADEVRQALERYEALFEALRGQISGSGRAPPPAPASGRCRTRAGPDRLCRARPGGPDARIPPALDLRATATTPRLPRGRSRRLRPRKRPLAELSPPPIIGGMHARHRWATYVPALLLAVSGAAAHAQDQNPQQPAPRQPFTTRVDLVTTDVVVRDKKGQFVPDLKKDDFEVLEDGVKQTVITFALTHGGRTQPRGAPPPPVQEGILLPPSRPTNDASGRIFLIFVDDLHLDFRNTGRIRDLFKKIAKELIHDGDMFGIVSTGPSSMSIDLTYDRKRLDEAIKKISGAGLKPEGHLDAGRLAGPARSPLSRARGVFDRLRHHAEPRAGPQPAQGVHLRQQRLRLRSVREDARQERARALRQCGVQRRTATTAARSPDPNDPCSQPATSSRSRISSELAELTRAAVRANTTIYTIDPRGLVGGPDLDEKIDMMDYQDYVRELAGQPARARRAHRRHRRGQSERLHQGAEAHRPGDQRLLRGRLLLDQSGSDQETPADRGQSHRDGANVWHRTSYTLKQRPSGLDN